MFQTKHLRKIKTDILRSKFFFFRKSWRSWDNTEKHSKSQTGQRWQYGACALH